MLIVFSALEGTLSWFLHHPDRIPDRHVKVFRVYYHQQLRNVIQYDPAFAHYDPDFFYRWKPGEAQQTEVEFEARYAFNTDQFRDDEASLKAPKVVFLGDSYTLGWGVTQGNTFPDLVEQQTGLTCLNAGVSSFGTAREFGLMPHIDTSALQCIVLQYCSNDRDENVNYQENQGELPISLDSVVVFLRRHFREIWGA
ncbi:MAG: DUF6473 family protein, partial [Bacteroidota bacterium]